MNENEEQKLEQERTKSIEQFMCAMHGIECEYGICDECPVTNGYKY